MDHRPLVECIPNFSEGQDQKVIDKIALALDSVSGANLLHVDSGYHANRTVMTLVGSPASVTEAAFRAVSTASELIDMRRHKGTHPRMGATDVCPIVPLQNISLAEVDILAQTLGAKVGESLNIPVYMYENSAQNSSRVNLASIRKGEYEGFEEKIRHPDWIPDYGPATFQARAGQTVIGARPFLLAYNVNLNTRSRDLAHEVAKDVRESGRKIKQFTDVSTLPSRLPGACKGLKAIGWYIEEFGMTQVSMNITQLGNTSLHRAFEACRESAFNRGMRTVGSELVGMIPMKCLLDAGLYYLNLQGTEKALDEDELIHIASTTLGLNSVKSFDPDEQVIERRWKQISGETLPLIRPELSYR